MTALGGSVRLRMAGMYQTHVIAYREYRIKYILSMYQQHFHQTEQTSIEQNRNTTFSADSPLSYLPNLIYCYMNIGICCDMI